MFYDDLIKKIRNLKKEYEKWKIKNILVLKDERKIENFNFLFNIKKRYFYIKKNISENFEFETLVELEWLKENKNLFLIFLLFNKYKVNLKEKNSYIVIIDELKTNIYFDNFTNKMYIKSNFEVIFSKKTKNVDKKLFKLMFEPEYKIAFKKVLNVYALYKEDYSEVHFFNKKLEKINYYNNFYFENMLLERIIYFKQTKRFYIIISTIYNEYFIKIYDNNKKLIAKTKTICENKVLKIDKNKIIFDGLFYNINNNEFYPYNLLKYKFSNESNVKKGFNLTKEKYLFSSDINIKLGNFYNMEEINYKNLTIIKKISIEINKTENSIEYNLIFFKNKLYLIRNNNELFGDENKIVYIWKNVNKYENKLLKEHKKNVLFFNI
ncbi:hypothetical protein [Fusobacterium polymorphum]|uniref:hypothetical protein n=1 Tax=Fusobacterium nucleatum subsp. polymorphum TaxID=76857 RepID=UPI00300ADBBC